MRISVGMKIAGGFGLVLLFLILQAGMAIYTFNTVDRDISDIEVRTERLALDNEIYASFQDAVINIRAYLLYAEEHNLTAYEKSFANTQQLAAQRLDNASQEFITQFGPVQASMKEFDTTITTQQIPLVREGRMEEAAVVAASLGKIIEEINDAMDGFVQENQQNQFMLVEEIGTNTDKSRILTMALSVIALLLGLLLAVIVTRSITSSVLAINKGVNRLAQGDFTQDTEIKSQDEIGQLGQQTNHMQRQLRDLIGKVGTTSQTLAAHSQELAASAEEVSATIEEVAGTTSEVSAVAQQSADNAQTATEDAQRMQEIALQGNEAVEDTIGRINSIATVTQQANNAVQELGTTSQQIGEIINVITGIADQTNLLALNAAIEAARAGEQGRGFAVVAEEVRTLAEQSANAAKEIADLISQVQAGVNHAVEAMDKGVNEVSSGVEIAQTAGSALDEIIRSVQNMVDEIQGLAQGAEQSNEGTLQLSSATEQISASIQETTAATEELAKMSEELSTAVGQFKV